jgi:hypothetical protein
MKKPEPKAPPVYVNPSRRGYSGLWKVATFVLLGVVIAQQGVYWAGGLWPQRTTHKRSMPKKIPLSPQQQGNIQQVTSRGGTVHYDQYNGDIGVSFAVGAPCEGCGQTWAFEPTGAPATFSDDRLVLLEGFSLTDIDFTDSGVSAEGVRAFLRSHAGCQITWNEPK